MRRCLLVVALLLGSAPAFAGDLHALLINGGGTREENYASHLAHLRGVLALLDRAGVPKDRVSVFASDGADPAPDLAAREEAPEGAHLFDETELGQRLGEPLQFRNSTLPGVALQPARRAALDRWFTAARGRLRAGDTLFLYVTDHGTRGRDPLDNRIHLWRGEALTVRQLAAMLDRLDPGVRVVSLMSQCFSGGFARLPEASARPPGNVCGYFASTEDRQAYGCYPEVAAREEVGHSHQFLQALGRGGRFAEAHAAVLAADDTPDVPLRTSDAFLAEVIARQARRAGKEPAALVDELLRKAWADRARWERDIRLLDAVASAFSMPSPRSLADLDALATRLPGFLKEIDGYAEHWREALGFANEANLGRFFADRRWAARVAGPVLAGMTPDARRALFHELAGELVRFTAATPAKRARIDALTGRASAAEEIAYRMEVRQAALLRLRAILTSVAGRVHLETDARDRATHERLQACEDLRLNVPAAPAVAQQPRAPFPSLDEDRRAIETTVAPAWMGIMFNDVPPMRRARLNLGLGASMVMNVVSGSPAEKAGLVRGDVVVGPPGAPFTERMEIKAWTMLLPIGKPQPVEVLRGAERKTLTLVPEARPIELPALPGPPRPGSPAPPLHGSGYKGKPPQELARAPHVLFFWATWCVPCKEALPELLAFARARNLPVVAVTDEGRAELDAFFAKWRGPFPEHVVLDEERLSFFAYAVSGTPTFVVIGDGKVRAYATGYARGRGLRVDGWRWDGR